MRRERRKGEGVGGRERESVVGKRVREEEGSITLTLYVCKVHAIVSNQVGGV